MRLLIVSNMAHYLRGPQIVGWGPTAQEIDHLATLFDEVRHVACLHAGAAPSSALPYTSDRVTLLPVAPAGGDRLRDKARTLALYPSYASAIVRQLAWPDVVHVRGPANIALLAVLLLSASPRPRVRWVKYAGNWKPDFGDNASYAFQRWCLRRRLHRGVVTVNGRWPDQPSHIHSFDNPSLTGGDLRDGRAAASIKEMRSPVRLLFVGALDPHKRADRALEVLARVRGRGMDAVLDVAGGGREEQRLRDLASTLGVATAVTFHGDMPRHELAPLYAAAHLILVTSDSEGWPKVLSEAMAYGAVPIASSVSSIPQYLSDCGAGRACAPGDIEGFAKSVEWYVCQPDAWKHESTAATSSADRFGYAHYLECVRSMLGLGTA